MTLLIRRARPSDYENLNAGLPREFCMGGRFGWTAERDGKVVALGSVTVDQWNRYWGWFNAILPLPAIVMHRWARRAIQEIREFEADFARKQIAANHPYRRADLYAIADVSKPGAWKWLERLGFVRDETLTHESGPVYRCNLERG